MTSFLTSLCNFLYQRHNRWFLSECISVLTVLINELRCPLRIPRKFRPVCRNKYRLRHFMLAFTNDQQIGLLFFIQIPSHQGMHSPLTHVTFLPNHLEYPISCTTNSHHVPSRGSSIMICGGRYVIMSSLCSISVDCPGSRPFLFYTRPSSNRVSPSSMFSSSISSFIFCYSYKFSRTTHYHTRNDIHSAHHIVTSRFRLAWICLPHSFFLPSKNDSSRLNVIYFLCSLPSTAWSITSNFMDLCLIDAVTSDDTFTNQ